jgi:hypothetical protein
MHYFAIAIILLLLAACSPAATNEMLLKHPTQAEWLEVYISHNIKETTDLWGRRVGILTSIVEKDKTIIITMSLANNEEPITTDAENSYKETAEIIVRSILEEYGIQDEYSLTINFI